MFLHASVSTLGFKSQSYFMFTPIADPTVDTQWVKAVQFFLLCLYKDGEPRASSAELEAVNLVGPLMVAKV